MCNTRKDTSAQHVYCNTVFDMMQQFKWNAVLWKPQSYILGKVFYTASFLKLKLIKIKQT